MVNQEYTAIHFSTARRGLPIIEFVFILAACLFYSNYLIQSTYQTQMVVAFTGYVVYCFIKEPSFRKPILIFMLMLVVFSFLYLILTDTSSISIYVQNRTAKRLFSKFSQYLLIFIPLFMFYRTATLATRKQVILMLGIIIVDLIILANTALTAIELDQNILHRMNDEYVESSGLSIAAYYFVYAYTFVILLGLIIFRNTHNFFIRFFSLVSAILSIYFLFLAQFALSLTTCFISILYLYYATTQNLSRKIIVIIGLVLLIMILPLLLKYLTSLLPDNILRDRLKEIYGMLTGENVLSDKDGQYRLDLYLMCIRAFLIVQS